MGPETAQRGAAAAAGTAVKAESSARPERLPPYAVVIHNDDLNTFEFVTAVIRRVFGYEEAYARSLMMRAHRTGRAAVWTGQKEHAEFKAEMVRSCGSDPVARVRGALPLKVTIEPLPKP